MNDALATTQVDSALRQARRERRRGHRRKERLLLRKAAFAAHDNAPLWNRYAFACIRDGEDEEAKKAFAQAAWLDRRSGNMRRAAITQSLALRALAGDLSLH